MGFGHALVPPYPYLPCYQRERIWMENRERKMVPGLSGQPSAHRKYRAGIPYQCSLRKRSEISKKISKELLCVRLEFWYHLRHSPKAKRIFVRGGKGGIFIRNTSSIDGWSDRSGRCHVFHDRRA